MSSIHRRTGVVTVTVAALALVLLPAAAASAHLHVARSLTPPIRPRSVARPRRGPRSITIAVVSLVIGILGAVPAQAHDALRSADPADGSTVAVAPPQVTLTFDEPALALGTEVEVRGPDGAIVSAGDPLLVDATVTQKLGGDLPAGDYTVAWRVTSADGHPITGELRFTASAATIAEGTRPTPSPTAQQVPAQAEPGGWRAPVVALVVLAAVALSWLLWRRRRHRTAAGG